MKLLTKWLRSYLPELPVDDRQLAEDLTLRGIAVEGEFPATCGGALYEMDLTTNRVDAMNHYGVAREAAAIYNVALKPLDAALPAAKSAPAFPVRIEADAQALCGRFTARVIRGVTVGASSGTVSEYFDALGQKRISAPVDATNFGWLAMGHPTHAFDLDKMEGGIVVRLAHAGEKLRLLDDTERVLAADDLIIADEKKALGLAGVMGGWESRVTEATKNILVEAAWFDPATIRRSSRRHMLHTDASHRFERGADFAAAPTANALVTKLILESCGGTLDAELVDVIVPEIEAKTARRAPIALSLQEVQRHLGQTQDGKGIDSSVIERYLTALGCILQRTAEGRYAVTLPSWRLDLEREIDLIEEIARVYGYNKFANTLPAFAGAVVELAAEIQERAVRKTLPAAGFSETVYSTFCSAEDAAKFGASAVAMGNPLSEEAGMLRPSLLPGMLTMLAQNLNRDVTDVRMFEMGTIFTGSTARVDEEPSLVLGATGGAVAGKLYSDSDALFYEMKGAVEGLLALFHVGTPAFTVENLPGWIESGRGARVEVGGETHAVFGELSAAEAQSRKLRQAVCLAEINLAKLFAKPLRQPIARELSRFQAVQRDFSFVFADSVRWQQISAALSSLNILEMVRATPAEIFRPKANAKAGAVAAGQYSLLVRVLLQSPERTLRDEELTAWSTQIVAALTALGGTLRA